LNGCIVLFGITRGKAKECSESLNDCILQQLRKANIKYKIYLHSFEVSHVNSSRSKENKIKVKDLKDWQLFNPNFFSSDNQNEFDLNIDFNKFIKGKTDAWNTGHENTKNLIRQLFSLQKSFNLIKGNFDFVFFSRLDLLYKDNKGLIESIEDVVKNPKTNMLYTPTWNRSGGLNDRIAICNHEVAKAYSDRINYLIDILTSIKVIHSEQLLLKLSNFNKFENKYFPFYAARIRADGRIEKN
jgi:hypothetical protein